LSRGNNKDGLGIQKAVGLATVEELVQRVWKMRRGINEDLQSAMAVDVNGVSSCFHESQWLYLK
jgi:hypothetical protein